ncbi:MAG: tetratricopeptide repeat protein [Hyphomicrobiaceae bacterium]
MMSGDNTKAGRIAATKIDAADDMDRSTPGANPENPNLPDLLNAITKAMSAPEPKPERGTSQRRSDQRRAYQRHSNQRMAQEAHTPTQATSDRSAVPSNNDEILASLVRLADTTAKASGTGTPQSSPPSSRSETGTPQKQKSRQSQSRLARETSTAPHAATDDRPKVAATDHAMKSWDAFSAEQLARHFEAAKSPARSSSKQPPSRPKQQTAQPAVDRQPKPTEMDRLEKDNFDWIAEKLSHISTLVEERNEERTSVSDKTAAVEARLINLESQIQSALGQIASQTAGATLREIETWIAEISRRIGRVGSLPENTDPVENQLRLLASRLTEIDRDAHDCKANNLRPALANDTMNNSMEDGGHLVADQLPPPIALPPPEQTEATASKLDDIVNLLKTSIDENRSEHRWASEKLEVLHETMLNTLATGAGGSHTATANHRSSAENTPPHRPSGANLRGSSRGPHRSGETSEPEDAGHGGSTENSSVSHRQAFRTAPFGATDPQTTQGIEQRLSRVRLALVSLAVVTVGVTLGGAVYTLRKSDPAPSYLGALEPDGSMMTQITTGAVNTRSVTTTSVPTGIVIQQPTKTVGSMATTAHGTGVSQTVLDAATNGNATAEFAVGMRYAQGLHGTENFASAAHWYRRSARKGYALAQYQLATLYERGVGVSKDIAQSKLWYERSARQGNIKSMHNLAVLTASDRNNPSAYSVAARWFSEAASYGLADSQFNLAMLYESGLGVEKDAALARKWFELAARAGDTEARRRSEALTNKIEKSEIDRSDTMIASWRARPINRLANDPSSALAEWQIVSGGGNSN